MTQYKVKNGMTRVMPFSYRFLFSASYQIAMKNLRRKISEMTQVSQETSFTLPVQSLMTE